ncbi:G-protein coupled receptor 54-like [Branchiostoma floridae]|uniref:G-protein coupled receptor 54-like n=1 Tax=Branchiostoma floridae TaxID=7739 RepID=A0A9J7LSN6_BRAFL|nr:G-protein coupled receptor 54-like [Branchiostoma floridae]
MSALFRNGSLLGMDDVLPSELIPDTTIPPTEVSNTSAVDDFAGSLSLKSGVEALVGEPDLGPEAYAVPTVFAIICAIGIAGNALVIFVVCKYQQMKSVTNYYIVNLAIADIAFLVCCVPFSAAVFATTSWHYGLFMCKFVNYFMLVTLQATCLTLAALSFDRYLAIVHPVSSLVYRTKGKAKIVSAVIWLVSFLASIPVAVYQTEVKGYWYGPQIYCRRMFPSLEAAQAFMIYSVLVSYVIPLMVSATSYILILRRVCRPAVQPEANNAVIQAHQAKQKRKVALMVATVVLLFTLSWLPNHILNLWRCLDPKSPMTPTIHYIKIVALCLSYANSSINPIVYSFMGEDFRKNFKKAFPRCFKVNAVVPVNDQLELPGPSGKKAFNVTDKAGQSTEAACQSTQKASSTSKDMQSSA